MACVRSGQAPAWLLKRIGLRRITLYDSRHTTLTLMEHAGVPISIVSKWAGHYDAAFSSGRTSTRTPMTWTRGGRHWLAFIGSPSSCERL
jgi:integrase